MAWVAVAVGIGGLVIKGVSVISANNRGNKALNAGMTAEQLRAQYQMDLSTTQNFEQWAASQTAQYQTFNQTTADRNTYMYAAAAIVVLVGGISLMYLLRKE